MRAQQAVLDAQAHAPVLAPVVALAGVLAHVLVTALEVVPAVAAHAPQTVHTRVLAVALDAAVRALLVAPVAQERALESVIMDVQLPVCQRSMQHWAKT